VVPPGKVVEAGWLVMGVPARPVRKMGPEEVDDILRNAREYVELWRRDYGPRAGAGAAALRTLRG
jgi:carbonic anhydrase/acetyltransferase-like protein (isoleucine patch superfamily)